MKYSVAIRKDLSVFKIEEGAFDLRHGEAFNDAVEDLLGKEQSKHLIIDFSLVKAIDTTVINSIRFAQQCANKNGGVVIFVSLSKQIKDLLQLQQMEKQLYIYSSAHEVMSLIAPDAKGKKAARAKKIMHGDDIIDELAELEVIAIQDIPDAALHEELQEHDDDDLDEETDVPLQESDESEESYSSTAKEPASKKRGRPKRTDTESKEKE